MVFADTFFYLALLREDDAAHGRALAAARLNRPILTTEFVLLELGMRVPARRITRIFWR